MAGLDGLVLGRAMALPTCSAQQWLHAALPNTPAETGERHPGLQRWHPRLWTKNYRERLAAIGGHSLERWA